MNNIIRDAIDKIYFSGDTEFFVTNCLNDLELPEEFNLLLKSNDIDVIEDEEKRSASRKFYINYKSFVKGDFKIRYKTIIQISKIVPAFYMQHEFEVGNIDADRMGSTLDGFDTQPYSKNQFNLQEKLTEILGKADFMKLTYSEITEVVCGLNFPEGVTIFGPQVTVEKALFNDVFGFCVEN